MYCIITFKNIIFYRWYKQKQDTFQQQSTYMVINAPLVIELMKKHQKNTFWKFSVFTEYNLRRALHGAVLLKWGWGSLLSLILSTNHCLLCQKYIWQQSLEHKDWEKPLVDHLCPLFICVNTSSFLLVYLSIWTGIHWKGAGVNLQWAKKILIMYLNYRYNCNISTLL